MTSRDFCYWLQGYFEIEGNQPRPPEYGASLNSEQIKTIRNHLNMVFKHEIDPSFGPKAVQEALAKAHQGLPITGSGGTSGTPDFGMMINC
jgi:hypothetical protein